MTRLVVILGFLIAFAAGFAVGTGFVGSRRANGESAGGAGSTTKPSSRDRGGWMERELGLSADQKEKMKRIWSDSWSGHREHEEKRRQLRRERDEAIADLVRPEDIQAYDAIHNRYDDAVAALDREMRKNFEEKVRQTKEILTPEQRTKYEKIFKDRDRDRDAKDRQGGGKEHDGRKGDERAASSRPSN